MTTQHTQLAPLQRAEQVLGFVERKAELTTLVQQSARILDIQNTAAYQERTLTLREHTDLIERGEAIRREWHARPIPSHRALVTVEKL